MSTEKKSSPFNLQRLVRENVRKMTPYSSARDEYVSDGSEKIFLDANENPFENGLNRYPDPRQRNLKSEIAKRKGIIESKILLGNGSDEVLDLLFRAFCEPAKDKVITIPPTYGMYGVLASLNDVGNTKVEMQPDFTLNLRKINEAVDANTKLIFICSPNNPTGNSIPAEQIEKLLGFFNGLVVIDEAYIDFSEQRSWTESLEEYPNLVITQTFSKAYGMAGIRLGSCFASEEVITVLNRIKPPYNVNDLTQRKAMDRLNNWDVIQEEINLLRSERGKLKKAMASLPFVKQMYHSDANFILVKVDNADKRYEELLNQGFIVRNRSNQPLCSNGLRFTIGTPSENDRLITALKKMK